MTRARVRRMRWFIVFCLTLPILAAERDNDLPTLTPIIDIFRMDLSPQATNHPVRIDGAVTLHHSDFRLLFVQDDTASIYIWGQAPADLAAGERVIVEGNALQGRFSPIVNLTNLFRRGPAPLPPATSISLEQLTRGRHDAQRVTVVATVLDQEFRQTHTRLRLGPSSRLSHGVILSSRSLPQNLVEARIRLTGVAVARGTEQGPVEGFDLYVGDPRNLELVELAPLNPWSAPVRSSRTALRHAYHESIGVRRIHLRGTLLHQSPDRALYLQDDEGCFTVQSDTAGNFQAGDELEVLGFLRPLTHPPLVDHGMIRATGKQRQITPVATALDQLVTNQSINGTVLTTGILRAVAAPVASQTLMTFTEGSSLITGHLELPLQECSRELPPLGSRVRIRAVVDRRQDLDTSRVRLLMRLPSDLAIVSRPKPPHLLIALAALGGSIVGGVLLLLMSHRRQRLSRITGTVPTTTISGAHPPLPDSTRLSIPASGSDTIQLRENHENLKLLLEERERLARDLHDNVIQTLFALGLRVESLQGQVHEQPAQLQQALTQVAKSLNLVIQDVRGFIGGLKPQVVHGSELKTALKSLIILMSRPDSSSFELEVDEPTARRLSSGQATHVLHIAREAMSNCVRHAGARHVWITLRPDQDMVCLEIRDDGVGFDLEAFRSIGDGLRNIRSRAQELDGEFRLMSKLGAGTTLRLRIPLELNRHE